MNTAIKKVSLISDVHIDLLLFNSNTKIDDVVPRDGDNILLIGQNNAEENGIYYFTNQNMVRIAQSDSVMIVSVKYGSKHMNSLWVLNDEYKLISKISANGQAEKSDIVYSNTPAVTSSKTFIDMSGTNLTFHSTNQKYFVCAQVLLTADFGNGNVELILNINGEDIAPTAQNIKLQNGNSTVSTILWPDMSNKNVRLKLKWRLISGNVLQATTRSIVIYVI